MNEEKIQSPEHLANVISGMAVGEEVPLTYMRKGNEVGVKLELTATPEDNQIAGTFPW